MEKIIESKKFNDWLFEACKIKASFYITSTAHDIFEAIDFTDAKLSFLDGMSSKEYALTIVYKNR